MARILPTIPPLAPTLTAMLNAARGQSVALAGMRAYVPGPLPIRLSVVLSNLRMQHLFDKFIKPGDLVVDVGANIGYNTLYAAQRVGAQGRVIAIEPAQDNLAILYTNLFANRLRNVTVLPFAAGAKRERLQFFLRGDISAVNSLYADNFYHPVTETVEVLAMPLDDLIQTPPALIKIDVEGGELAVLEGMSRLLKEPTPRLIVEWHPVLQVGAGRRPDELPRKFLDLGFRVSVVSHTQTMPLRLPSLPRLTEHLLQHRSPVELLAERAAN